MFCHVLLCFARSQLASLCFHLLHFLLGLQVSISLPEKSFSAKHGMGSHMCLHSNVHRWAWCSTPFFFWGSMRLYTFWPSHNISSHLCACAQMACLQPTKSDPYLLKQFWASSRPGHSQIHSFVLLLETPKRAALKSLSLHLLFHFAANPAIYHSLATAWVQVESLATPWDQEVESLGSQQVESLATPWDQGVGSLAYSFC